MNTEDRRAAFSLLRQLGIGTCHTGTNNEGQPVVVWKCRSDGRTWVAGSLSELRDKVYQMAEEGELQAR